jgi:hypothetical protein
MPPIATRWASCTGGRSASEFVAHPPAGRRWEWVERALAFDARIDANRQAAVEKAARDVAQAWQERDMAYRQRKYDQCIRELNKIDKMLEFPLATLTTETNETPDGRIVKITTVKPGRWTFDTVGRLGAHADRKMGQALRNEGPPRVVEVIDVEGRAGGMLGGRGRHQGDPRGARPEIGGGRKQRQVRRQQAA